MGNTRAELIVLVQKNLAGRTDIDSTIGTGLDQALQELGQEWDFDEMKSTPSDVSIFTTALTFTDGTWTEATLTLVKTGVFDASNGDVGKQIYISGGANADTGWFTIVTNADANTITLSESIGADADGDSDIESTGIGQSGSVALPTGTYRLLDIRLIDGTQSFQIEHRSKEWITGRWANPPSRTPGRARFAWVENGRLFFNVPSDTVGTYRFTIITPPSIAAGDAAEPTIDHIENFLISYSTWYSFMSEQQFESSRQWERIMLDRKRLVLRSEQTEDSKVYRADTSRKIERRVMLQPQPWLDPFAMSSWGGMWICQ